MKAVFEKPGIFSFRPSVGDFEAVQAASLVSARLYSTVPTDAQRADTTNTAPGDALQSITVWDDGLNEGEKLISYAVITDPTPTDTDLEETYYFVVSYRLDATGAIINDVEPFRVFRAEGVQAGFNVTPEDVYQVESKLRDWMSTKIGAVIVLAQRLITKTLQSKGLVINRLEQEDARDLVLYQTLVIACNDLSAEDGDSWWVKSTKHSETLEMLLKALPLGYDNDKDGLIELGEQQTGSRAGGVYIGI